ncbi:AAA domain-containing protein [Halobacteriovorax sp. ZH5_bin.2]|uniref:AAA domain-containing protein n=1 Tax=Halobacteriovorax sp. ZH5_bin.2 TaxID=3157727 RepID=UPI0037248EBD
MEKDSVKRLVTNLFSYVKEIKSKLENPILDESKYDWKLDLSNLPDHPYIFRRQTEDYFIKVKRPRVVECPTPPVEIENWVKPSWKLIDKELDYLRSMNIENEDGTTTTIHLEDFPDIVSKIEDYRAVRERWKEAEYPSERVRKVFSHLHEVKAKIEKDSEGLQLYLTEGVLQYNNKEVIISHPLIFKEIAIELDGEKDEPEIIITKSDVDSAIFISLLRSLEVSGSTLNSLKEEFSNLDIDPDDEKTELFLKSLVHKLWQDGVFSEERVAISDKPTVFLEQKIILAKKESSFVEQIDNYIKKINDLESLPVAYQNMVGYFEQSEDLPPALPGSSEESNSLCTGFEVKKRDYYLTKEYNSEQKKIINLLEDSGCVSVQGPPGTGKSHTIANLVGHLLARGESVLVSSHRSKALEVIRDQVVDDIRPLCVSILDNQTSNKEQLQKAVNFLEELLSKNDSDQIAREIDELKGKRDILINDINELEASYLKCVLNEYSPIAFQGESILPKDAALFIAENNTSLISGHFNSDVNPISSNVLGELKSITRTLKVEDYFILKSRVPPIDELLSPADLKLILNENSTLKDRLKNYDSEKLSILRSVPVDKLTNIYNDLNKLAVYFKNDAEEYIKAMMDFMLRGEQYLNTFNVFLSDLEIMLNEIESYNHVIFEYAPKLESDHDLDALITCAENIYDTTDKEVKFSFFAKIFSTEMKIIKNESTVQGRELKTKEEVLSVVNLLKTKKIRKRISEKWSSLAVSRLGAPGTKEFTKNIEDEVSYRLKKIKHCVNLYLSLKSNLEELGEIGIIIPSKSFEDLKYHSESLYKDMSSYLEEIDILFLRPAKEIIDEHRVKDLTKQYDLSLKICKDYSGNSDFTKYLYNSLESNNYSTYEVNYNELARLTEYVELESKYEEICRDIGKIAPDFSIDLLGRSKDELVLNIESSVDTWKASYLEHIISERNKISPMTIQDKLTSSRRKLKRLDANLIQKLAVSNQLRKITPRQRQALRGFVIAQNKITKSGRGVRDAHLRKEAKWQMKECRGAVPVWIMPLSKVMDNFVIGEDSFDVLIIDEASQADITNLPVFSMAKKVIVVGDDKQVSPSAAGKSLSGLDELINEFLEGIPNKGIYDYKASLYDIACASFGETIRLTEHFRCTPEIIQFCNDLQYQGNIKPLRESNSNPTPPSLVPYFVEGAMDSSKKNIEEAVKITSIIAAMASMEKYKNLTIGVISLFGNVQHQIIDKLLRSTLSTVDYEKHKIVCGKSPQFQGDERNIIFLSMVESPNSEGPMRKKSETDLLKKEYNVAVSRAKDQLWIMHSMSKDIHLQSDDIRLKLLKHAHDPRDLMEKYSHLTTQAESHFEESIHKDLLREDYLFEPQFPVGAYRIDIVLFTEDGKRIALECDGEKFHSTEEQVRNDLERQAVLERLGFTFVRIRGSDYYRRREETVDWLYNRLNELNVKRGNEVSSENVIDISIDEELLQKSEIFREQILESIENEK